MSSRLPKSSGNAACGNATVPETSSPSGPDPPSHFGPRGRRRRWARLTRWTGLPWRHRPHMPSMHGMTLRTQRPPVILPPGMNPDSPILGSTIVGSVPPPLTLPDVEPPSPPTAHPRRTSSRQGDQLLREEEVDSEAETEIGPFLGDPVTPPRDSGRAWFPRNRSNQDFPITEDPVDEESPRGQTPVPNDNPDEERENLYGSEYEDEEPEVEVEPVRSLRLMPAPPRRLVDWSILEAIPADGFGRPFDRIQQYGLAGLPILDPYFEAPATTRQVHLLPALMAARPTVVEEGEGDAVVEEYRDNEWSGSQPEEDPDDW